MVAEAAAAEAAQVVTSSNNLLNDTQYQVLPLQNPGLELTMLLGDPLHCVFLVTPPEGEKTLSVLSLPERENTPCVQSPKGEGKTPCVQSPPEGGKTPCVQSPPEEEKTLVVQSQHTPKLVQFKSVFISEKDLPVGGRLRQFLPEWKKHGSHQLITGLIRDGYKLPFRERPNLPSVPCIISSYTRKSGILQPSLPGSKTRQPLEASYRLEFTKQIPGHPKVQDGDPRVHTCLPQEGGMGHIHRSHRRLLTRANSHPVSKIPQISFQRRHLPVHQPPLRASNSPPHFHQYSQRGKTDGFAIRNQTPPIPGQLVDPCPLRTTMHGPNTKTTKVGERFGLYSKPQEVRTQTISEVQLPGLPLFTRFGSCEAHARQVDQASGDVPSPLLEVCYQCKDSYVHHWIACINGEDCKIVQDAYETFSVASQNSLEISDTSGHTDPLESEDDTTRGMVVRPSKCATRRTSPPQGTQKTDIYRCLKRRLGHSLRSKLYRRALVSEKHSRTLCPNVENSHLVSPKQRHTQSKTCTGLTQCDSGQPLKEEPDPINRVVPFSTDFQTNFQTLGESPSGPVRNQPEQKASYICLSDPGSSGMGSRCPQHSMGKPGCFCVPSHRPAAQGCTKTSITNMQDNSDSPRLADKTMVLGPGGDVSGHSKTAITHTHSAKTTTEQPLPCQPNIPEPPRLVSRSSALEEHGFTAEVAERIAAPQRLSTRSIYTAKWTVFQRWCTEKQVDFRNPSIGDICNFF